MKHFYISILVTILGLGLALWEGGVNGIAIATLLVVMEVTLSFDNAVVNATVLKDMDEKWQKRFLTWGMLIAVFGMRFLFPLLIVALATHLPILEVGKLAIENPEEYSRHVLASHVDIAAFGGMFLLMVFLHFVFDAGKELHWLVALESRLAALGKLESVEIILALLILLGLQGVVHEGEELRVMIAGTIGVVLYVAVNSMTALMAGGDAHNASVPKAIGYSGFMGFMYLQILDASFSLDGVIGAFAISKDVLIIMIGLGIGAMFVRSMTVYMVHKGTLTKYIFLEHGAHYGIGALALIMLISLVQPVSEVITGLIGILFIGLALVSSVRHNRKNKGLV